MSALTGAGDFVKAESISECLAIRSSSPVMYNRHLGLAAGVQQLPHETLPLLLRVHQSV